jgi:hypothetical protein
MNFAGCCRGVSFSGKNMGHFYLNVFQLFFVEGDTVNCNAAASIQILVDAFNQMTQGFQRVIFRDAAVFLGELFEVLLDRNRQVLGSWLKLLGHRVSHLIQEVLILVAN